jgi:hypothetical protein
MTMDPMTKSHLKQTIYVHAPASVSTAGEATYTGSPASRLARVDKVSRISSSRDGDEIAINWEIVTELEIALQSRIWLPGADQTDAKEALLALEVEPVLGEIGENLGWLTSA